MASKDFHYHATPRLAITATAEEEHVLLQRIAQGDAAAFWALWERYRSRVLFPNCVRWMNGNRADAEDALSSASLRAWRYLPSHAHNIKNIKAWLTRLLYNHCMSIQRAHHKRLQYIHSVKSADDLAPISSGFTQMSAEDTALLNERGRYICRGINALPLHLRKAVILYFYGEMRQRDIATHLKLSPENLRKRLQHARVILRTQLTPYLRGDNSSVWKKTKSDISSQTFLALVQEEMSRAPEADEDLTSQVVALHPVRVGHPDGTERHVHLALDYKPTRQRQKVETLQAYIHRHPTGWRKRLQLAELFYVTGEWEEAILTYRHVLNRQPHNLSIRLRLGQMLHFLGRDEEALTVYQNTLNLPLKADIRHYITGHLEMSRQHLAKAVKWFTAATALKPQNADYAKALGLAHLHADQPVEALRAFERVLERDPADLVALTYSHAPLVAAGREAEAQKRMKRALRLDSGDVLALTRLADSYCRRRWVRGESKAQITMLLRRALQIASENPDVQASRAYYHMARGEWDTGLAVLRAFTTKHPRCPEGWYHYARWCLHTGATQNAAEAIMQAYTMAPHDAAINKSACCILSSVGKFDAVRLLLDEMLKRFPNHWSVWATAARILVKPLREKAYACSVSARASALQPNLSQAWFKHGRVLALADKHQEAITAFEHGWQLLPADADNTLAAPAAMWLGESYHALGEASTCREWWTTAVRRASTLSVLDPSTGFYWQGKALSALDQQEHARQAYRRALCHHLGYPERLEVNRVLHGLVAPGRSPLPLAGVVTHLKTGQSFLPKGRAIVAHNTSNSSSPHDLSTWTEPLPPIPPGNGAVIS